MSRITRNRVVQRWGTPQETLGSVNEPRDMVEHDVRFNEKWTFRSPRGEPVPVRERLIYWYRYDFIASFVVADDGRVVPEDIAPLLAGIPDRREHLSDRARTL